MIVLKSEQEIESMRKAGALASLLLDEVAKLIKPGISTQQLNDFVHKLTLEHGATSAPLHYRGFPKSICTSINNVICHGIPSKKDILKNGDIINVDVTPIVDGFHGDSSRTFAVGKISDSTAKLITVTKECLDLGIAAVEVGARIGDIGHAIQTHAEKHGFSVVRDFVGHGIGRQFHEDPQIPHYGKKGQGPRLEAGMVFTIEPMINTGKSGCRILKDGWTAVTEDGSLSCQFEHTLALHLDGRVEILTL